MVRSYLPKPELLDRFWNGMKEEMKISRKYSNLIFLKFSLRCQVPFANSFLPIERLAT